jgi:predicted acylesterase/phospholipase RssA
MNRHYPLHTQNLWTAASLRRPAISLCQLASSTRANLQWAFTAAGNLFRPPPAPPGFARLRQPQEAAAADDKDAFAFDVVSSLGRRLGLSPPVSSTTNAALAALLLNTRQKSPIVLEKDLFCGNPASGTQPPADEWKAPDGQDAHAAHLDSCGTYPCVTPPAQPSIYSSSLLARLLVLLLQLLLWPTRCIMHVRMQLTAYRSQALQRAALLHALETAPVYSEWRAAALALDALEGPAAWKLSPDRSHPISAVCNLDVIEGRLAELCKLYNSGDTTKLAFALRQGLERNVAGICHPDLHKYSRVGTKRVVEDYVNVVAFLLLHIAYAPSPTPRGTDDGDGSPGFLSTDARLRLFNEARHAYGRTALLLSGGAAMGLNHLGVVKTLLYHDLLPRVVSGTSAGSLVASIVGIFADEDLKAILASDELRNPMTGQPFSFRYFDEGLSMFRRLQRLFRKGAFQDIRMLQDCLRKNFGDTTFAEAYGRTRRILNITVCPARDSSGPPMLLNYLTTPNVLIWSAASASCALPMVFAAVELVAKDSAGRLIPYQPDGRRWIDGSITSDIPIARIGELFNVNHFIVSQTNPHVIPKSLPLFQTRLALLIKSEFQFRYWQALQLRLVPRLVSSLFPHMLQPYEGDVTIMPEVNLRDLMRLFNNPTVADVRDYLIRGERQTFPELDRLRLHCLIERTLDGCVEAAAHSAGKANVQKRKSAKASSQHKNPEASTPSFGRVPSWLWAESRRAASDLSQTSHDLSRSDSGASLEVMMENEEHNQ